MKVALIHHSWALKGGLERVMFDIARGLREAGDDVGAWARSVDPAAPTPAGVEVHRVRTLPMPRPWRSGAYSAAVGRLGLEEKYHLTLSLARTDGHDVYICGGTHPGFLRASGKRPGLHDRNEIAREHSTCASSRHIVAHSKKVAAELAESYPESAQKIRVIYPTLDGARFFSATGEERREARRALGIDDERTVFLFPATGNSESKGLPLLLQAFARLPRGRSTLLVAGRAPREAPGDADVRALGFIRDMRSVYLAADCTVLPSRYEAFGMVIAESLQCGTPVITSRETGVSEILSGADGIVLEALSADCLQQALIRVCAGAPQPEPDFAARHGLGIEQHVRSLKQLARSA